MLKKKCQGKGYDMLENGDILILNRKSSLSRGLLSKELKDVRVWTMRSSRRDSMNKGPEKGMHLMCLKTSEEASVSRVRVINRVRKTMECLVKNYKDFWILLGDHHLRLTSLRCGSHWRDLNTGETRSIWLVF